MISPYKESAWIVDSGCSHHMTGNKSSFISLEPYNGGTVTFGSNLRKSKIVGIGKVGNENLTIKDVYLVEGLNFNLLSESQLCDAGYTVKFDFHTCQLLSTQSNQLIYEGIRDKGIYCLDINHFDHGEVCFSAISEQTTLWHRRLGHYSIDSIRKLIKRELVRGLSLNKVHTESFCDAYAKSKLVKSTFKSKDIVSTTRPLEMLHMDLFGPISIPSLSRKKYVYVIVDDFSRYTWTLFLQYKEEAFENFEMFAKLVENEKGVKIKTIRSDNGGEFVNSKFVELCVNNGYRHEFSTPRTPQQNGVVERKNRTLQEMARSMINESNIPKYLWAEAVNTACYIINRVSIRPITKKTPYELWKNRKPNIAYFRVFGVKCFVLDESPKVTKFDAKSQEGIFVGYSKSSKAYRVFLPNQKIVIESVHVKFNETTNLVVEKGIEIVGEEQPKEVVNNTKNSQGIRVEVEDEPPQVDHGSEDQNVGNEETTPTPTQDE